jgi:hypothetical protein
MKKKGAPLRALLFYGALLSVHLFPVLVQFQPGDDERGAGKYKRLKLAYVEVLVTPPVFPVIFGQYFWLSEFS